MKKVINFCGNCPFVLINDNYNLCRLSAFFNLKNLEINVENEFDSPDWCPLKKEDYSFYFKKFSNKRIAEINEINNKIDKLSEELSLDDERTPELSYELQLAYKELKRLYENEEISEEEFAQNLSDTVEKLKENLSALEEAGVKLQESLNNLNKL